MAILTDLQSELESALANVGRIAKNKRPAVKARASSQRR
jgi:hypothetical protein